MNKLIPRACRFGQNVYFKGTDVTNSVHCRPLKTQIDKKGNTLDILSITIHDREQNAVNSNVKVLPVNNSAKKFTGGVLAAAAVSLGIGGFFFPPLFLGAVTCGIVSAVILAWGSSRKDKDTG